MTNSHFAKLSHSLINQLSHTLSESTRGYNLSELQSKYPKLTQALQSYRLSPQGCFYRSVGLASRECASLRFGQSQTVSASLITETAKTQPVYTPRYTAAVGMLLTEPLQVQAVHHTLMTKTLQQQTPEDMQQKRQAIVMALKHGLLQDRVPRIVGHGMPRQENVNESLIRFSTDQIAALVVPEDQFRGNHDSTLINEVARMANTSKYTNQYMAGLEQGRLTAQLGYITAKLGDLPILTFDGKVFDTLHMKTSEWQEIFSGINQAATAPFLTRLLNDTSDCHYAKATGFQSAAMEVAGLDQLVDIHELKHVGGNWTSLPVDFTCYWIGHPTP